MRLPARLVALSLSVAALIGFHVSAKPRPDAETIRSQARMFSEPSAWRDRIAPDFELTLLDGSRFRLADHVGRKVIVLNFFATWCGPCRAEMPELERYARSHAEDVLLLAIDAEEKHTVVEAFVAELRLTIPVGIDGTGDIGKAYGVSAYPTTVVIGADGRVKLYTAGAIANADITLDDSVKPEQTALREGRGITAAAYHEALASTPQPAGDAGTAPLTGRARHIAEAMTCPCGCSDKVNGCSCSTAKRIRARLAAGSFGDQTDVQIIEALNREFCVKVQ